MYKKSGLALFTALLALPTLAEPQAVPYSSSPIAIDGHGTEQAWRTAQWHPLNELMVGAQPAPEDFSGRYKLLWDEDQLYLLVEVVDDVLIDTHPDPRVKYWDDDTLEIFLDEDASGGDHLNSYNAFAYHVALDGNVADIGTEEVNGSPVVLLNDHVKSKWTRADSAPYTITWEAAVKVYPDSFTPDQPGSPVTLTADKILGFMLAYCDNDGSKEREHFVGSHAIEPVNGDKNRGYIDASVFGKIRLSGKTN